jgi:hypothetical protein
MTGDVKPIGRPEFLARREGAHVDGEDNVGALLVEPGSGSSTSPAFTGGAASD